MSEQPTATARPAGGKKILGVPRTTFYLALAGAVVVGLAFYWWRNYQAGVQQASSGTTSGTTGSDVDYSGELSTLQTELEALQQQNAPATTGGGSSGGGGGGWSGGGDSGSGGWNSGSSGSGSGSSGNSSSGDSGNSSSGSSTGSGVNGNGSPPVTTSGSGSASTGGGTTAVTGGIGAQPSAPSAGKATRVSNNGAVVSWNGGNAAKWTVKITGPGSINGRVSTVTIPQATYSGLSAGHNYEVLITPYSASGVQGHSGTVTFQTTK